MTTQRPVPQNQVPTNFLLTQIQKQQKVPSGILPSGQENYFDTIQDPDNNAGFPINAFYPSPASNGTFTGTGLLATYAPTGYPQEIQYRLGQLKESGILNFYELFSLFSNSQLAALYQVSDFNIFNPYVHYYSNESLPVLIPYVSDYEIVSPISPY